MHIFMFYYIGLGYFSEQAMESVHHEVKVKLLKKSELEIVNNFQILLISAGSLGQGEGSYWTPGFC